MARRRVPTKINQFRYRYKFRKRSTTSTHQIRGVRRGPPGAGTKKARVEEEVGSAVGRRGSEPLGALYWGQTWALSPLLIRQQRTAVKLVWEMAHAPRGLVT